MIGVLLMITILLWLLSAKPDKDMLVVLGSFLVVQAVCEYIYFFPLAAIISLIAAICVWLARFEMQKQ